MDLVPGTGLAPTVRDALNENFSAIDAQLDNLVETVRVATSNAELAIQDDDVVLLVNKTVASASNISLPAPTLSRRLVIKDMKGDAATNPITLDAGTGKLINGLQTLVMEANWETTTLIGMSDTQWGTL